VVTGGWLFGPARWPERSLCAAAAALLLYLQPLSIGIGAGLFAVAIVLHLFTRSRETVEGQGV
jgi:hypothetical protein